MGSRDPPAHRPCPPRAVPPALPRLCRSRGAASPCASRACVARVACRVGSPRSPPPRRRSHGWGAAVTRPSSGPGIRFWRVRDRGPSLGCGLWRTAVGRLRRVAGRVGGPVAAGGSLFGGGGRVRFGGWVCASVEEAFARYGPREGERLSGRPSVCGDGGGSAGRGASGDSSGPVVLRGRRLVWGTATAPGWVPGGEIPPRACFPPVWRWGLRSMTLPVPEARPSVHRGPRCPPSRPSRGKPSVRRRLFLSRLPPPAFLNTRAARLSFAASPSPLRLRLSPGGGRRSFSRQARWRGLVPRPAGSRSPGPARRVADHPVLPGVAPRCRVRGGGPAVAPRPLSSPARGRRLGSAKWPVGAVCRAGNASVSRRLGGSRRVASPGSVHPPPSSRSPARPSASRRALSPSGGVSGKNPWGVPVVVPAGDRRPRGPRFSPRPPAGCNFPHRVLCSLPAPRLRSTAGQARPSQAKPSQLALLPG